MPLLFINLLVLFSISAHASQKISDTVLEEYHRLREIVSQLEPDGQVGGLYDKKEFPGYTLMWKLDKTYTTIRFYREGENYGDGFSVTYKTGTHIVRGQNVVRRFIGPERTGWRNHTVDLEDGSYYGAQGASQPQLTKIDKKILSDWHITVFPR